MELSPYVVRSGGQRSAEKRIVKKISNMFIFFYFTKKSTFFLFGKVFLREITKISPDFYRYRA